MKNNSYSSLVNLWFFFIGLLDLWH